VDERAATSGEASEPEESEEAVRAALLDAWTAWGGAGDGREVGASSRSVSWGIAAPEAMTL